MKEAPRFLISQADFDADIKSNYISAEHSLTWWPSLQGAATFSIPFKLRPRIGHHERNITTDVTIGGVLGLKWRISRAHNFFVEPVVSAGVDLVDINPGNSLPSTMPAAMNSTTATNASTVPAFTMAAGAILELDGVQLGALVGRDYASGDLANSWIYNTHTWYSFSIGFAFFSNGLKSDAGNASSQ